MKYLKIFNELYTQRLRKTVLKLEKKSGHCSGDSGGGVGHCSGDSEYIDRSYEKFVILPENIIQELHDICLELSDIGYNVNIMRKGLMINGVKRRTSITIRGRNVNIKNPEVSDVIARIEDYIHGVGFNTNYDISRIGIAISFVTM